MITILRNAQQTHRYLNAGRRLRSFDSDDLKTLWVLVVKKFWATRTHEAELELNNVAAELRLRGAVMTVCVIANCPLARATPSQTGLSFSGIVSDGAVWTWPIGRAEQKTANSSGGNEVWTWPISKEARSPVWTEAKNQVSNKGVSWKIASLRSVSLGGL